MVWQTELDIALLLHADIFLKKDCIGAYFNRGKGGIYIFKKCENISWSSPGHVKQPEKKPWRIRVKCEGWGNMEDGPLLSAPSPTTRKEDKAWGGKRIHLKPHNTKQKKRCKARDAKALLLSHTKQRIRERRWCPQNLWWHAALSCYIWLYFNNRPHSACVV